MIFARLSQTKENLGKLTRKSAGGEFPGQRFSELHSLTPKTARLGFRRNFSVFFQQIMPLAFELRGIRNFGQETLRGCFSYSVVGASQLNAILHVILATLFAHWANWNAGRFES
jgi:hypothetical protein